MRAFKTDLTLRAAARAVPADSFGPKALCSATVTLVQHYGARWVTVGMVSLKKAGVVAEFKYCASMLSGGSYEHVGSTASTISGAAQVASVIGIDLSAKTGHTNSTHLKLTAPDRRLRQCGTRLASLAPY